MPGFMCHVGCFKVMQDSLSDRLIDIADYINSNPHLLDLKVRGIGLFSRTSSSPALRRSIALLNDESSRPRPRCRRVSSTCCKIRTQEPERVCLQVIPTSFVSANCCLIPYFVSQSFLAHLDQVADACNYTSYLAKYLTYPPPPAPFPFPGTSIEADPGCDVHDEIIFAALLTNNAFDIYRIFDMVHLIHVFHCSSMLTPCIPASCPVGRPRLPVSQSPSPRLTSNSSY
jgi:hypothetical protein